MQKALNLKLRGFVTLELKVFKQFNKNMFFVKTIVILKHFILL